MKISRAVPMLPVPVVLLMVPLALLGFVGQFMVEWQGGFITGFPVVGWLQDGLGPSALEGFLFGAAYGAYRVYRKRNAESSNSSGSDDDKSARRWIQRHRVATGFATVFLIAFIT